MYLVVRRALNGEGGACADQVGGDTGSRVPLRLFADRAAAEAFVAKITAEARRTMNPFPLLDGYLSDDLMKRLAAFEFPRACPGESWHEDWRSWWDLCQDLINDEERAAVWAALGATPLYEVIPTEVGDG